MEYMEWCVLEEKKLLCGCVRGGRAGMMVKVWHVQNKPVAEHRCLSYTHRLLALFLSQEGHCAGSGGG